MSKGLVAWAVAAVGGAVSPASPGGIGGPGEIARVCSARPTAAPDRPRASTSRVTHLALDRRSVALERVRRAAPIGMDEPGERGLTFTAPDRHARAPLEAQ